MDYWGGEQRVCWPPSHIIAGGGPGPPFPPPSFPPPSPLPTPKSNEKRFPFFFSQIMLETYRFVVWMDTSIVFRTAELDDLFTKAREQGVMARHHSLAAHTNEQTFIFLQEPPCLFRHLFITVLIIFQ